MSVTEPCPYCETEQEFHLRHRPVEGKKDVIEVYISCKICPFEQVLRESSERLEELHRIKAGMEAQAAHHRAKYGVVPASRERAIHLLTATISAEELLLHGRRATH